MWWSHSLEIAEALGNCGGPKAVEVLLTGLKSHGDMKKTAIEGLGKIGDQSVVAALTAAADTSGQDIRDAALHAIEQIQKRESTYQES